MFKSPDGTKLVFQEDNIRNYLDKMIDYWRQQKELAGEGAAIDENKSLRASCYLDAYQSVMKNLFGEIKP
jgi:hypothetical protein